MLMQGTCLGFAPPHEPRIASHSGSHKSRTQRTVTNNAVGPTFSSAVVDPSLEAESLTVMAHLALDFSGFVLSPSRSLIRLFAVMGRICSITADYLVDHSIHTEELMIQLFLISVALKELCFEGSSTTNTTTTTIAERQKRQISSN
jgi:hypothetical protein